MNVSESPQKSVTPWVTFGPLPPPRHGAATVNEAMISRVSQSGSQVSVIDTASEQATTRARTMLARGTTLTVSIVKLVRKLHHGPKSTTYISLSAGPTLMAEALAALIARTLGGPVILHHHSFRYLDEGYWPMRLLVRCAGTKAVHVVLCQRMKRMLESKYPKAAIVVVISNGVFVQGLSSNRPRTGPLVVGLLSNLTPEKGLWETVALARLAHDRGQEGIFQIAGPFADSELQHSFLTAIRDLPNMTYVGPLNEQQKRLFYAELDVFVFPTSYRVEAEPLVLLDALAAGCPVIAHDRGCIAEIVDASCGQLVPRDADFAEKALDSLVHWDQNPVDFAKARVGATNRAALLNRNAEDALMELVRGFSAP